LEPTSQPSPSPQMSTYYVPTTPPVRGRAYSLTQPSYPYPATPYSGYNTLAPSYHGTPGMSRSATYYVTPSVSGRSRSHSRPRHSSHHHRSHHHGHHRRSHSARPHHRPTGYNHSYRPQTGATSYARHSTYRQSPSLGSRILSFFGLGNSNRYVDQYGHSVDSRGRPKHKY